MATITGYGAWQDKGDFLHQWQTLTETNADGAPVHCGGVEPVSVQVTGNFGTSGQCDIEGSNDGTNWVTLTDEGGTPIEFTAAGLVGIRENPRYIRPNISAGSGVDLDVALVMARRG